MVFSWAQAAGVVAFSWQMDLVQCAALVGFNHPWKGQFCGCDSPLDPDHQVYVPVRV